MRTVSYSKNRLLELFSSKKVVTLKELKKSLGTNVSMTVFRKLKELNYLSSCSHRGKYYTINENASFDENGLWLYNTVLFSVYGSFQKTVAHFIENSEMGMSSTELDNILKLKSYESLIMLYRSQKLYRNKFDGVYIYFSMNLSQRKRQIFSRKTLNKDFNLNRLQPEILMNELKAALIIFYCSLNEKQKRLYAGLESLKFGHGGDSIISEILDINPKTVAKGRKELLEDAVSVDTIRDSGGGRKKKK